jgi:hypothetical protein
MPNPKRKTRGQKFSEAPRVQGVRPSRIIRPTDADVSGKGDWYLILKQLEYNGVAYLPLNHHLVEAGSIPERVPSNGAKGHTVGDSTVPLNVSGKIDVSDMPASTVFKLFKCRTITPIDPAKSQPRLVEGQRKAKILVPAMVPPVRRVTNLREQYQQATSVPMTVEGIQNFNLAQAQLPNPFSLGGR